MIPLAEPTSFQSLTPATTSVPEPVPGAGILGYSFNVFGEYSIDARISPLFDLSLTKNKSENGFLIPENTTYVPTSRKFQGTVEVFESRQEYQNKIALQAGLTTKISTFFSLQFDASYSNLTKSDADYQFTQQSYVASYHELDLVDTSSANLAPWVKADPIYQDVPATYDAKDPVNRGKFFAFFEKYGLAFISRVRAGARLTYSSSVEKSSRYDSKELKVKAETEFKALFISAKASASAEWEQIGKDWTTNRTTQISVVGGSDTILKVVTPGYGANFSEDFSSWLATAEKLAAVTEFNLKFIEHIFDGPKFTAVARAREDFTRKSVLMESRTGYCAITYDGNPRPEPASGDGTWGFQITVIDRKTLRFKLAKSYVGYAHELWTAAPRLYEEAATDLVKENILNSEHIVAFATWSTFGLHYPTPVFANFLRKLGAGFGLSQWQSLANLSSKNDCCELAHCNYLLLGIQDHPEVCFEEFSRAGSCDTGRSPWMPSLGWTALPAKQISIATDVFQLADVSDAAGLYTLAAPRRTRGR